MTCSTTLVTKTFSPRFFWVNPTRTRRTRALLRGFTFHITFTFPFGRWRRGSFRSFLSSFLLAFFLTLSLSFLMSFSILAFAFPFSQHWSFHPHLHGLWYSCHSPWDIVSKVRTSPSCLDETSWHVVEGNQGYSSGELLSSLSLRLLEHSKHVEGDRINKVPHLCF